MIEARGGADLVLSGEYDIERREELRERFEALAAGEGDPVVDMSEVTFMDSSGMAAIADLVRALQPNGRRLLLTGTGERMRRLLEIVGLDEVVDIT